MIEHSHTVAVVDDEGHLLARGQCAGVGGAVVKQDRAPFRGEDQLFLGLYVPQRAKSQRVHAGD